METIQALISDKISSISFFLNSLVWANSSSKISAFLLSPSSRYVPNRVLVQDIMHQPCLAIEPHMEVQAAAQYLADTGIQQVPVMSGTKLLGVVSIGDILMAELPVLVK